MLTPLSSRSIKFLAFRKGAIIRHGQIGQTDAFQCRPTALISLLYLFRQCAYFSAMLISLPSLFQCCKFFQRVPETDQMAEWYRASASGSVDLGFDSESGQTKDLKIGIHSFPA